MTQIHQNLMLALSTFRIVLIVQATVNTFKFFFYTKESQSFVKPSSFKSQALKFSTKSITNAVLSTNLFIIFLHFVMFAASNIVAFTHPYANTFSNPLIRSSEGLALKTSAFQYFYGSKIDLRPCGTPIYEAKFCLCFIFQNAYLSALLEAI